MAEKRKGKKRKDDFGPHGDENDPKPSKDEYKVAKWLRKNVPIKKTKFLNHNVEYFTGYRAIDGLLESKFAQGTDALFETRNDVVNFLQLLLEHRFYHRARKVPVSEQELKSKKKDKKVESGDEKKKEKGEKGTDAESSVVEGNAEITEKSKRKRKVRLEMHNDQRFVDGLDAYVWIYEPIPFYYWICGTLLVLGAIGICLFPLWPPSVRLGVYYLSIAAAGFLVFIILLVVLRLIIFCLVWIFTIGKHHIWILPNLTEDVGFFASFWPLYHYEYKGKNEIKKSKKKKKDKESDGEDEIDRKDNEEDIKNDENLLRQRKVNKSNGDDENQPDNGGSQVEVITGGGSESESESSQRSSTGKDFEMVDQEDLDES
ncbi:translocation protein SEC62 [Onthophagus taurus]|uniref:translocation protein SEC62 n=1 Tax=Onthophagus taurus TaxID=166361 RepID=UPI0039BE1980